MKLTSIALMRMRGFPEQLLPVAQLRFQRADAIEKGRKKSDAVRLRRELEAGIVELRQKLLDRLGRLLNVLPKHGGSALVGVGDADRLFERVGNCGKKQRIALLRLPGREQRNLRQRPAE